MKPYLAIAVLLLLVGLQVGWLGAWKPMSVVPNLIIVMLAFSALLRPASQTLMLALSGGLLLDLFSGHDFGLRMGVLIVFALSAIFLRQFGVNTDSLWAPLMLVAAGTILYNLAVLSTLPFATVADDYATVATKVSVELALNLGLALISRRLWWLLLAPNEGPLKI